MNLSVFAGWKNPDWEGYRVLFQSGSWLADQGRDLGFLAITDAFKAIFGQRYEIFRALIAAYFLAFTFWAARTWRRSAMCNVHALSFVGLLPLFLLKFTVQIREGIATTLVFAAFSLLFRRERTGFRVRGLALPIVLMLAASTIHGGANIALAMFLVVPAFLWCGEYLKLKGDRTNLYGALVVLTCVGLALNFFSDQITEAIGDYVASQWTGWAVIDVEADQGKLGYWVVKSLCTVYLVVSITKLAPLYPSKRLFVGYLKLGGYLVVPVLQVAILYLVWSGQSAYFVSLVIRAFHSVFFMLFGLVMLLRRKTALGLLVAMFFLLDDYRVVLAAVD